MSDDEPRPLTARVIRVLRRLHASTRRRPSPAVQRLLLVVAAVLFLGGAVLSARALGIAPDEVDWRLIAVAGLGLVPVTLLANAEEYRISGRMLDHRIAHREAIRITIYATAANLLPLPGALVVRTQALRQLGSRTRSAASATTIVGLGWIGVSLVLAGSLLVVAGSVALGIGLTITGVVVLGGAHRWLIAQIGGRALPTMGYLLLVETGAVSVNALRLVLVLTALGVDADLVGTFVLAVSSSLASATGILPGGFGVREGIGAALSPLVGLPAAAGFIGIAANRVLGFVVLAPLSGAGAFALQRSHPADAPNGTPDGLADDAQPSDDEEADA